MAIGVPEIVAKNVRKLEDAGLIKDKHLASAYLTYLVTCTHLKNSRYLLPGKARIKAFQRLGIDPSKIQEKTEISLENNENIFSVKDGEWDKKTYPFKESSTYTSLVQRFEEGLKWEETELYQEAVEGIKNGKSKWGCETVEEYQERCRQLDELYTKIEEEGFKSQKEINSHTDTIEKRPDVIQSHIDSFNEVRIMIGRNGELIHDGGMHRTCIAKIIGLEKIPVIISLRHKKWQEKRNLAIENPEKLSKEDKNHPDIKLLLK